MLSERKKSILKAVIDDNIRNAEPVSSKDLQEKYLQNISSATIRNELMALEEMGYLFQPHSSSGRLPTADGFRKYIDEMLADEDLTNEQIDDMAELYSVKFENIEDLAVKTAKVLSDETNYASIVVMGEFFEAKILNIKLVKITDNLALVVIVTDVGVIKDITIELTAETNDEDCILVSKLLTNALSNKTIEEINSLGTGIEIGQILSKYKEVFDQVVEAIKNRKGKTITKVNGASNLLSQPEYKNIDKAQKAVALFEHAETLTPILKNGNDLEVSINIGSDELEDCSVVSLNYKVNGKPIGRAGVIGPMRMDYKKVIKVLKELNKTIDENFKTYVKKGGSKNNGQEKNE